MMPADPAGLETGQNKKPAHGRFFCFRWRCRESNPSPKDSISKRLRA